MKICFTTHIYPNINIVIENGKKYKSGVGVVLKIYLLL